MCVKSMAKSRTSPCMCLTMSQCMSCRIICAEPGVRCSPLDESWIDSERETRHPNRGGRSGRFDRNSFSVIMAVIMLLAAAAGFGPAPLVEPLRLSAAVSSRRAVSARMQESLTAFLEDRAGVSSKFMPQVSAKFVRNSTSGGCRRS